MSYWKTAIEQWGLYTDFYELTMAQGYFKQGMHKKQATFEYLFRSPPFGGGFALFAGLAEVINFITQFAFSESDIQYLRQQSVFEDSFLDYLKTWRPSVTIRGIEEGRIVFPGTPVLQFEGSILDLQLLESAILNILNFSTLIATKALRMRMVTPSNVSLIDFGMRRAHGLGALLAARSAIIGGFDATSCVMAGKLWNIPVTGTMAHSWVQSFPSEKEAFITFAKLYPSRPVFLVDTYDTLNSGVPAAIEAAKELQDLGIRVFGVRLDSGDFVRLVPEVRYMLDQAGFTHIRILVSNKVDEYLIKRLSQMEIPVDGYGVGTRLVVGHGDPALDGVYKLVEYENTPRFKTSDDPEKILYPGKKDIYRIYDRNGRIIGDIVSMAGTVPDKIVKQSILAHYDVRKPEILKDIIRTRAIPLKDLLSASGYKIDKITRLQARIKNGQIEYSSAQENILKLKELAMSQLNKLPSTLARLEVPQEDWRSAVYIDVKLLQQLAELIES